MNSKTKVFYIMSHPKFEGWFSIGISSNLKNRFTMYQTHVPDRLFKIEYFLAYEENDELELFIKHLCEKNGTTNGYEWVNCSLEYIKGAIEGFLFSRSDGLRVNHKYIVFSDREPVGEFRYLKEISKDLKIPYHVVKKMWSDGYYPARYKHIQIEKA